MQNSILAQIEFKFFKLFIAHATWKMHFTHAFKCKSSDQWSHAFYISGYLQMTNDCAARNVMSVNGRS